MQTIGVRPAARAAWTFMFTVSSVSPNIRRRSEWPMMAYSAPASFAMSALTSPVNAPCFSKWMFCTATPIVVLSGLPGVGKTALATHVAHRLRPRFPDGQLYVNLRGYANAEPVTPKDVLARFLRALGLAPDLVPLEVDEQSALYRSMLADKRVLVVLDNANAAEHDAFQSQVEHAASRAAEHAARL